LLIKDIPTYRQTESPTLSGPSVSRNLTKREQAFRLRSYSSVGLIYRTNVGLRSELTIVSASFVNLPKLKVIQAVRPMTDVGEASFLQVELEG
jgi:hypothetical protein